MAKDQISLQPLLGYAEPDERVALTSDVDALDVENTPAITSGWGSRSNPKARSRSKSTSLVDRFWKHAGTILFIQGLFNLFLACAGLLLYRRSAGSRNPIFPQLIYSPVQASLSYKAVEFEASSGKQVPSVFRSPPSEQLDAAWMELAMHAVVSIPRSQAKRMPYKTRPISKNRKHYVTQIDVFHQLHCLNGVRIAYHRDHYQNTSAFLHEYGPPGDPQTEINIYSHLEHCVENVRQSLMCSVDVSPMSTGMHTCRDWDRVLAWGKNHSFDLKANFDSKLYIHDNLVDDPVEES